MKSPKEKTNPDISPSVAEQLAKEYYGIQVKAKQLVGEVDFNFHLLDEEENEFTLKISRSNVDIKGIEYQNSLIEFLSETSFPYNLPKPIKSLGRNDFEVLPSKQILRLQQWVPGRMLSEVSPRSNKVLFQWGSVCGQISKHLVDFDHPGAHRFYKWDPTETLASKENRHYLTKEDTLSCADYFWDLFEKEALPKLGNLRKSVNHNDAHEHNLLVNLKLDKPEITGLIDFGDSIYTLTINELAIACAYAAMSMSDPLDAMTQVIRGYHSVFPIEGKELELLFYLIVGRLLISVANSAKNSVLQPENTYLQISQDLAWDLLFKLKNITPSFAHYRFREACQLEPCPQYQTFVNWVNLNKAGFSPVIQMENQSLAHLDLSVGSTELGNNSNFENTSSFKKKIQTILVEKNADIGIGGYGEIRPFYATEDFKAEGNNGLRWRTLHLGIDVWLESGVPVCTPLNAEVFSVKDNVGEGNYGPTIILKHQVDENFCFYTLYGHLSLDSLEEIEQGKFLQKGQVFARIGNSHENGNWPPHLHFQIMLDMLGNKGDFSGVSLPDQSSTWMSICPDPVDFFTNKPLQKKESSTAEILLNRKQILGRSLSIAYEEPLHIVRGYKQYLYDNLGQRYLDTVNNVPHVGHQHPRLLKAAQDQMAILNTNTRYLHEKIVIYAKELLARLPDSLSVVHFVNSGSEANELALRMLKAYTGQKDMIAVETGYHGNTGACIDVSSYKFDGKGGKGAPIDTHVIPIPDTYRGLYQNPENAGEKYASHIIDIIKKIKAGNRKLAGFICESIMSCGGQITLPDRYLETVYQLIRSEGGLCIADEVQVGFGRVGECFWGFELQNVIPDIVTMGKPMGNGHPLAAVVCTPEVAEAFANGMEYFNTFGGNPVSCVIGKEVLDIIRDENLQEHAKSVGNYLKLKLIELQQEFPIIGDVRGHGLFLGFELVNDRKTKTPASKEASYLSNRMRERGILMSTDGPFNNVLKIKPPMCFSQANADFLIENLSMVFSEDFCNLKHLEKSTSDY